MKYVIIIASRQPKLTSRLVRRVFPFVFPEYLTHSKAADRFLQIVRVESALDASVEVVSAGFYFDGECVHGSESLQIAPNKAFIARDENYFFLADHSRGILPP